MIHLRLIVPAPDADTVLRYLTAAPGVAHVIDLPQADATPAGRVILCDVVREAADEVIEWLQGQGVHRGGAIVIEALEAVVSDAAEWATASVPGHAGDALIWEELEWRARSEAQLTPSFLLILSIAAVIAGVGILLDSPILIVGAMVVGPEYGPIVAICAALVRRRYAPAAAAAMTLTVALAVGSAAALIATLAFRVSDLAPDSYGLTDRQLTAFISRPDALALVVALLAGVVGMLSITEARAGTLVGVLVSVTTIPAAANIGVATAYGAAEEVAGSALQLVLNLTGLIVAGALTLVIQSRGRLSGPESRR